MDEINGKSSFSAGWLAIAVWLHVPIVWLSSVAAGQESSLPLLAVAVIEAGVLFWLIRKLQAGLRATDTVIEKVELEVAVARREAAEASLAKDKAEAALLEAQAAQSNVVSIDDPDVAEREQQLLAAAEERAQQATEFETRLSSLLAEIREVSETLGHETEQLSTISADSEAAVQVATGATGNVSDNVNSVAASAEEMSASVNEISRQVTMSAGVAEEATRHAKDSESRIRELADRADKINEVLKMIGDIAEQTNLLALNATIEAARAGDAGKGFAVVASEVKSLANQSANATEEIGKLLAGIRDATNDAVNVNNKIVSVVSQISDNSNAIASAVKEQSAATEEIARAAQMAAAETVEAGRSVENMHEVANKVSNTAEVTAGAVSALSDKTEMLFESSQSFIASIRQ